MFKNFMNKNTKGNFYEVIERAIKYSSLQILKEIFNGDYSKTLSLDCTQDLKKFIPRKRD